MLHITSRKWVAIWYRCPRCRGESAYPMLSPSQYKRWMHRDVCIGLYCDHCPMEIVERRWYTTFAIDAGVSDTVIAGTLASIGPFKVCDIAMRNIRVFRKWYRERRAEVDRQVLQFEAPLRHARPKFLAKGETPLTEKAGKIDAGTTVLRVGNAHSDVLLRD